MENLKLYDSDFLLWSEQQAELLRCGRFDQLDLKNLIEEVANFGKSEIRACVSYAELIILHLLYLDYWDAELERNRYHWESELDNFRLLLEKALTGSIKNKLIEQWDELYADTAKKFKNKTGLNAPSNCPFTIQDILG